MSSISDWKTAIDHSQGDYWCLEERRLVPSTQSGGHLQFKHNEKPGRVTVPIHSRGDLDRKTLLNILMQAGLSNDRFRGLL